MNEANPLGPILEPPVGGLQRLKHSVTGHRTVPAFRTGYWTAAGAVMSAAMVIALSMLLWGHGTGRAEKIHEAVRQALAPPARTYFTNAGYTEIPTGNSHVRILVVASLDKPGR